MNKLKICIITPIIYPVPAIKGGAVEGLVELLVRINEIEDKMDLTIVSLYEKEAEKSAKNYVNSKFIFIKRGDIWDKIWSSKFFVYINKAWIKLKNDYLFAMPFVKRIWKKIATSDFDYYILEGGGDYYNFGYLHKKISKDKLLVHFHGEVAGDEAINNWFGRYIAVSNYIGRRLICNGKLDVERLCILQNCFDRSIIADNKPIVKRNLRKKYGIEPEDFVYVYWGRLVPAKGVLEAVKAFKKVSVNQGNAKLLIVGNATFGYETKSEYDKKLEKLCCDNNVDKKVKFTGFIPHNEMGSVLGICDVGLIPSIWDEPAALTVFEGLANKLPIITTSVGGTPEIIKNGYNGILIKWSKDFVDDIANAMDKLYNSEELREHLSSNAYTTAMKYTDENFYNNFVDILKS